MTGALLYVPLTVLVTAWAILSGPRTWRRLQSALRGTFAQHADQAIAVTGPPAPGRARGVPVPGRQTPAAAGTPPLPPPPGLTPADRSYLAAIGQAPLTDQARSNGRDVADQLIATFPRLPLVALGRIVIAWHREAFAYSAAYPPGWAMRALCDALTAAAADLTDLERMDSTP